MSVWTHVVGAIRVDGLPKYSDRIERLEEILGPECFYDNWKEESTLPRGSEGSLQYRIIQYYHGMPWVIIPIWGDLRDYDNVDEIKHWFQDICKKLGSIRDAVLQIQVEGRDPVVISNWDFKEETDKEDGIND